MNTPLTIIIDLVRDLSFLLLLLIFSTILLFLLSNPNRISRKIKSFSYRYYINTQYILISAITLIAITIIYWLIDTQLFSLNIPAQPYIFFTLLITLLFGYKIGILASILSTILIIFYLYEPRYTLLFSQHVDDFILTFVSLSIAMIIGNFMRDYQRRLIIESDQLKSLIKARDNFTSIAAHDLKTPLTVIKLYLQSLLSTNPKSMNRNARKSLIHIDKEADKIIELINTLFDFSRLESNKVKIVKKKWDIVKISHSCLKDLSKIHKTHQFIFICKHNLIITYIDQLAIERVLSNLLTNAVKYSPINSIVRLTITKHKNHVTISVKDQGDGIPLELQSKLFDPFYQRPGSEFGLGLGLYIAKSLVELHQGKIWFSSTLGKGTTFYIRLPID